MTREEAMKILGVTPNMSLIDVKHVYDQLAHKYHPCRAPKNTSPDMFRKINVAYTVLNEGKCARPDTSPLCTYIDMNLKESSIAQLLDGMVVILDSVTKDTSIPEKIRLQSEQLLKLLKEAEKSYYGMRLMWLGVLASAVVTVFSYIFMYNDFHDILPYSGACGIAAGAGMYFYVKKLKVQMPAVRDMMDKLERDKVR